MNRREFLGSSMVGGMVGAGSTSSSESAQQGELIPREPLQVLRAALFFQGSPLLEAARVDIGLDIVLRAERHEHQKLVQRETVVLRPLDISSGLLRGRGT